MKVKDMKNNKNLLKEKLQALGDRIKAGELARRSGDPHAPLVTEMDAMKAEFKKLQRLYKPAPKLSTKAIKKQLGLE